jgi:hypothetical protein
MEEEEKEIQARIAVTVGDLKHVVSVVGEEKPDAELDELARAVLAAGEKAKKNGVTIKSLNEGLEKLASGALAPQTLEVVAQRSADAASGRPAENWLLIVSGRRVRDREGPRGKVVKDERVLRLTDAEFRELVSIIQKSDPSRIPRNIYAPEYSRLRIQVLNQPVTVEAREFAGMSPSEQGEGRENFDRIWKWCEKQHSRTLASGRKVAIPVPARSEAPTSRPPEADPRQ